MLKNVSFRVMAVSAILAMLLIGCSGGSSNKLIGNWEGQISMAGQSLTVQVEFTKDKINITTPAGTQSIDYTYVDSKTIKATNPLTNQVETETYTLSGNKLSFTILGQTIELTKK